MGDVGSLALGGAMGVVAVLIKQEILLLFIGGVFVIEALSVDPAGGELQDCARSASSAWRRCTTTSKRWAGRNRRSSRASGSSGLVLALFALTTLKLR